MASPQEAENRQHFDDTGLLDDIFSNTDDLAIKSASDDAETGQKIEKVLRFIESDHGERGTLMTAVKKARSLATTIVPSKKIANPVEIGGKLFDTAYGNYLPSDNAIQEWRQALTEASEKQGLEIRLQKACW